MPQTSRTTKSGTPRLSEQAKHLVVPSGIVSTGWPGVRRTCVEKLGITFDPWQDGAGRVILAKREDGTLAAMVDGVGMSLPRQAGKTYLIAALVFALCVNTPGLLVIWTAHHGGTSSETFLALQGFAKRAKIAPHVRQVFTGSGDEEIRFHNEARILFGAREHGFGRGIPGVDVLIFDEAQILSDKAMSNMLATMNTSRFGLHLYLGTPPKPEDAGRSETFKRMRREALAGTLEDGAWIEFGADPDAADDDRQQWRKANPSFPKRTPVQSMLRLQRKLTAADFRREALGVWDENVTVKRAITDEVWSAVAGTAPVEGVPSYGVKFSVDGATVSLAVAVKHEDGRCHVELVKHLPASKSGELVAWLTDGDSPRWRKAAQVVVDGKAGAGAFESALREAKVARTVIIRPTADQYTAAHKMFSDAIDAEALTQFAPHGEPLDLAVAHATKRTIGNQGGWGWGANSEDFDITPLDAVTLAFWAAMTTKRQPGKRTRGVVL